MRVAESLPILQLGQQFQLIRLLIKSGFPQEILFVGLVVLEVGQVVILDSTLNGKHLG